MTSEIIAGIVILVCFGLIIGGLLRANGSDDDE